MQESKESSQTDLDVIIFVDDMLICGDDLNMIQ